MQESVKVPPGESDGMTGKTIEDLYKETGLNCPYLLARCIGLKISHREDLAGACGLYLKTYRDVSRLFISTKYDPETQEDTCAALLEHHLSHNGMDRILTIADLLKFQQSKTNRSRETFRFISRARYLFQE